RIFQDIRIEVNGEVEALKELLQQSADLIKPGGRLSLISYHSLEDRLVKRIIRDAKFEGQPEKDFFGRISVPLKQLRTMQNATDREVKQNKRARSAKLRIGERVSQ